MYDKTQPGTKNELPQAQEKDKLRELLKRLYETVNGPYFLILNKIILSELLGFWTLPNVWYSRNIEHDVSETGSVSVLR
jgi:hypothetical protein